MVRRRLRETLQRLIDGTGSLSIAHDRDAWRDQCLRIQEEAERTIADLERRNTGLELACKQLIKMLKMTGYMDGPDQQFIKELERVLR